MNKISKFSDKYFGEKVSSDIKKMYHELIKIKGNGKFSENTTVHLYKTNEKILLTKPLGNNEGGEGAIYETNKKGYVVKIYKDNNRTTFIENKILEMIKYENTNPSICWPIDAVYYCGNFIGVLMQKVCPDSIEILTRSYNNKRYNRIKQVDIIIKILNCYKYLHDINVLVGDVKEANITYNSITNEIALVDIDSVQINEYPCVVSSPMYNAPEVIKYYGIDNIFKYAGDGNEREFQRFYTERYRDFQQEYYAITVLLFKILMGDDPYNHYSFLSKYVDDLEDLDDDDDKYIKLCVEHRFAYSEDESTGKNDDSDETRWSHLPSIVKKLFVSVFAQNKRIDINGMLAVFKRYREALGNREMATKDPDYNEIEPRRNIAYNMVKLSMCCIVHSKGFTFNQAIRKALVKMKKYNVYANRIQSVSTMLTNMPTCRLEALKFSLIYNIGIIKKIKVEMIEY